MRTEVPSILEKICRVKAEEVVELKWSGMEARYRAQVADMPPTRDFYQALSQPGMSLIAEFKQASPSKGDIRPDSSPEEIARLYEECGASAISVLTDEHFKGKLEFLQAIRDVVEIPLLRKDFIIDPAQIYEARAMGADAVLLIAAILSPAQIREYRDLAESLGMHALVESHNEKELERAIRGRAKIYGINNRNLSDFSTDRQTTLRLLTHIPEDALVVTESAIHTPADVKELSHPRVNAMLVGESIMSREKNPTLADMRAHIRALLE
ncbi:MAG: indole-3-glycerol phosphate synthase TrpC [Candidatus Peregrinibacteria bacterium]|nr:indole-3-glycerol phosphate synthase TrpC [Candidatus Peregrinibacteria bacterium]